MVSDVIRVVVYLQVWEFSWGPESVMFLVQLSAETPLTPGEDSFSPSLAKRTRPKPKAQDTTEPNGLSSLGGATPSVAQRPVQRNAAGLQGFAGLTVGFRGLGVRL